MRVTARVGLPSRSQSAAPIRYGPPHCTHIPACCCPSSFPSFTLKALLKTRDARGVSGDFKHPDGPDAPRAGFADFVGMNLIYQTIGGSGEPGWRAAFEDGFKVDGLKVPFVPQDEGGCARRRFPPGRQLNYH